MLGKVPEWIIKDIYPEKPRRSIKSSLRSIHDRVTSFPILARNIGC